MLRSNLSQEEVSSFKESCFQNFLQLFDFESYQKLDDSMILNLANTDSEKLLSQYEISMKSKLTRIKELSGIPRLFAYAYGGIAYHDLITGEIVLPSKIDYPSSLFYRIKCIYHEVGHSLYFSEDLSNNIFQTKAMLSSSNSNVQALAYLMILTYTDFPISKKLKSLSPLLYQEILQQNNLNHQALQRYYVANFLKNIFKSTNIQNKSLKYGYTKKYLSSVYLKSLFNHLKEAQHDQKK
ncbi:hypothetical protein MJH12_18345 [bacterium]|nr:hypothetical protein [bacterium]